MSGTASNSLQVNRVLGNATFRATTGHLATRPFSADVIEIATHLRRPQSADAATRAAVGSFLLGLVAGADMPGCGGSCSFSGTPTATVISLLAATVPS
jgi:hypothetical protein